MFMSLYFSTTIIFTITYKCLYRFIINMFTYTSICTYIKHRHVVTNRIVVVYKEGITLIQPHMYNKLLAVAFVLKLLTIWKKYANSKQIHTLPNKTTRIHIYLLIYPNFYVCVHFHMQTSIFALRSV